MARRRRDEDERERSEQAPMLGVLSVLLLLIPALMLMAHVTAYAQVAVNTPYYGGEQPDHTIRCGRDRRFHVGIAQGAFFTRVSGEDWQRVSSSAGYDREALTDAAWAFKREYPHATIAYVTAEADVDYQTLVAAIDAVRGPDCRLAAAQQGEEVPAECLLYDPVVEHREANWSVPQPRRGDAWPPRPPRSLGTDR
ncbi:MAG: hypothetical protein H6712_30375 [Myxococcales bacterium]|nr:hypothetical protein [Myxococcales bacterium]MCB9718195.1 hypothetical protein [Myxococcales bacterium]